MLNTLKNADFDLLVPAYALNLVMLGLMAYRWQILYRISAKAKRPSFGLVLSASFIGVFFNNFLPSTIGGDTYRTMHMSRVFPEEGLAKSLSIIFIDRIIGLLGMALSGLGALFFRSGQMLLPTSYSVAMVFVFISISVCLVLSISSNFQAIILYILSKCFGSKGLTIQGKLKRFFGHLNVYESRKGLLGVALFISILLRLIWFYGCYIVALSLQLQIPLIAFFIAIPLIELIRMIPITFQGIGVRESLFILFFDYYGVSSSDAVLLAIVIYFLLNINGVLGGFLYLFRKSN